MITFADIQALYPQIKDAEQDKIEFLIADAAAYVETYCRRCLDVQSFDQVLDGPGGKSLVLPRCPVVAVTGLYIDEARAFSVPLAPSSYSFDPGPGIVTLYEGNFSRLPGSVRIVYQAGWSILPAELAKAIMDIVLWNRNRGSGSGLVGVRSQINNEVTTTYETVVPINIRLILDKYKSCL